MDLTAHRARRIFDGAAIHEEAVLLVEGARILAIRRGCPDGANLIDHGDVILAPGFVDLQVNGGGGVMLGESPTVEGLRRIAEAHLRLGTTALLPTLITDRPEITAAVLEAGQQAVAAGVPGIAGLHLEGPHLSVARKGAHDAALIRPMAAADLARLQVGAAGLPVLKVTVAPETVPPQQIAALTQAGVLVSLGHSDADFDTALAGFQAGARCVTHLFNAMSQLGSRTPGLVGAALADGRASAGLIADGVHVHSASMAAAWRAKAGPGRLFLVTDAMAVAGTDLSGFDLGGRRILRGDGRLTLADGTLAGADLTMAEAVRHMAELAGMEAALAMATSGPADVIGQGGRLGWLREGRAADFVALGPDLTLRSVWQGGRPVTGDA